MGLRRGCQCGHRAVATKAHGIRVQNKMAEQRFQHQRFELKYLISEEITPNLRDFVSCYLELDDYAVGQPNLSYPVFSVYFDSDDLKTYHATINGDKNRFKLRLRYYDDLPETPVFFEVKGRSDYCILKQRCAVRREAVALLSAGQLPEPGDLLSKEPRHLVAFQNFNRLLLRINARPKARNRYLREAWVSPNDNSVRVTFDREVYIEPCFRAEAGTKLSRPVRLFPDQTILEIKFTNRFPNWFKEMVRRFNLVWAASAKYAGGVLVMGEHAFHDGYATRDWEGRQPMEVPMDVLPNEQRPADYETLIAAYD